MSLAGLVQRVGELPLLGRALRSVAGRYREGSVVTIRTGLAKGYRWRRYHRYVNGYWIGHYELSIQRALGRELRPGDTFYDVGANAGFFTLVAARMVGPTGRCIAFDPLPENVECIREQIQLNRLDEQCRVLQQAIGNFEGQADFGFDAPGSPKGHLGRIAGNESRLRVHVTTLDAAARQFGPPSFVKMDIEGAEVEALRGAAGVVAAGAPWLIELHSEECARGVANILSAAGYRFFRLDGNVIPAEQPLPHHVVARRPAMSAPALG